MIAFSRRVVIIAVVIMVLCVSNCHCESKADDLPVIVVGGGLAGLSAAIAAVEEGAKVVIIDGEKDFGGNSAKASSGINGCNTRTQKALGFKDSFDQFYSDTMKAGDQESTAELVDVLVHDSAKSVHWLMDLGVPLEDINLLGGHSVPRTHWLPSPKDGKPTPVGVMIMRALKQHVEKLKSDGRPLDTMTNTLVTDLIVNDSGDVTGVRVKKDSFKDSVEMLARAVILATGGFSADKSDDSLLAEFAANITHFPTTNGAFATGAGVKMARKIGAKLVDMNRVQLHPTAFIDPKDPTANTKFLAAEALRGSGAIMLNEKGERFANELGRRDYVTQRMLEHCAKNEKANGAHSSYLILNEQAVEKFGWPAFNFYWKVKGFFTELNDAVELVLRFKKGAEFHLGKMFSEYSDHASKGTPDEFGKTVFPAQYTVQEKIWYAQVTPAIHYTMGGVAIDARARVLSQKGSPISGLYAAGEVTGGVHGSNRLGGNSLLECVVFGRIAGEEAANKA